MSTRGRYRNTLSAALVFLAGVAISWAWVACGPANVHDLGEVCSPYAEGQNKSDGGSVLGDCKSGLYCVCAQTMAMASNCRCAVFCGYMDAGTVPDGGSLAYCGGGYGCIQATDPVTRLTNSYCFPDGGM